MSHPLPCCRVCTAVFGISALATGGATAQRAQPSAEPLAQGQWHTCTSTFAKGGSEGSVRSWSLAQTCQLCSVGTALRAR